MTQLLQMLQIGISLCALVVLCAFYVLRLGGKSGAAPLAALSFTIVFFSIFACLNQLFAGGVAYFVFAAGLGAYLLLFRKRLPGEHDPFFSPGMVLFLLASAVVIVVFALRQPIFMEWDEFSFWGMAPKLVKETGVMYSVYPSNMRAVTFTPGLVAMDYFFQFFSGVFVPWMVLAGYDILLFAVFAAVLASLTRKQWYLAAPGAMLCFLAPFLLTIAYRIIYVAQPFLSAYADIPMGLLFGGAAALYFSSDHKMSAATLVPVVLALGAEAFVKDMGFALALVAAALIGFDLLFIQRPGRLSTIKENLGRKLLWCGGLVAAPAAAFAGWSAHMSHFMALNRLEIGGSQNMGMAQMVFTGLGELFSPARSEHFSSVMGNMAKAFYQKPISMFSVESGPFAKILNGSGLMVVCLIFAILLLAFLAGDKKGKERTAWFALLSALGFAAFYIFNGFTYVYVFHDWQSGTLVDYNRYIYPYYLGWFLLALTLLLFNLRRRSAAHIGVLGLLALTAGCMWRFNSFVQPRLSVIDVPQSYYRPMRDTGDEAALLKESLPADANVFFISQGDEGMAWFVQYYYLFPLKLDYSFGGGTLSTESVISDAALSAEVTGEDRAALSGKNLTPENLCRYLSAKGCDYIYIQQADETLRSSFGQLFTDGLSEWFSGGTKLYRIEKTGGEMRFVPYEGEVAP